MFDLLGTDENDVTFAIGWTLRESPEFFRLFVAACGGRPLDPAKVLIRLQRYERGDALVGITDIEIVSTEAHLLVEAKRGWAPPTRDQLEKYLPRLKRSVAADRRFVVLTRHGASARALVKHAVGSSIGGFPIVPVGLTEVAAMARKALRVERSQRSRIFVRELLDYLEGAGYVQSHRDSRVHVVALGSGISELGIPFNRVPYERGVYWYGDGRPWPKEPPVYFGFRFGGRLQSIHHVDQAQQFGAFRDLFPESANDWGPGTLVTLGPPIRPDHPVRTGRGIPQSMHAQVDIDLLLTCDAIDEAFRKTKERDRIAREHGLA